MSTAYLDHAATSRIRPVAAAAYARELEQFGNPSSLHAAGRAARARLEEAREQIAQAIGARPVEVVFTSGGSEADAIALAGIPTALAAAGKTSATVISAIEHDAVRLTARATAERLGHRLVELPTDSRGVIELDALDAALQEPTGLVSVMWANNETGVIQPIADVIERAHAAGALVHSDAVQAVGRIPVDFAASGLDALSLTGHKIGAPVGTGVLVAKTSTPITDLRPGGGQERAIRSGTLDVAGACALAAALTEATAELAAQRDRLAAHTETLRAALAPLPGVRLTGEGTDQLPGFVHVIVEGANSEALLLLADMAGLAAASSSACHAGVQSLSHVVAALGYRDGDAIAPLRLSLGWDTTDAEVAHAAATLPGVIAQAQAAGGAR